MKYRILFFTAALIVAVSLSSHASFQDPANTSDKPLYQPNGSEATVRGTISVNGSVPGSRRIDMSADPICMKLNRSPHTEWIVTNQQKLKNAFVYIKEGDVLESYRFAVPQSDVTLTHNNCNYAPHVLGVRAGQRLTMVNNDPTIHNTHPVPKLNREWNMSQPAWSEPLVKVFEHPEILIPFKDNQHPWERAYVGVMDHPFFAVSDGLGNYEIRGLPPGTYKLVVWHERLGEQEVELTIGPGESRQVDFTLDVAKVNAAPMD